ncbi:MAG: hypothetical protein HC854_16810 [Flavobacterium sp.]|nr:hypothetical protein [Flavobacterium sp.]
MIRVDNNWTSTAPGLSYNGQYTGVPNNGSYTYSIGQGYNLLGNPYPSPMNADRFILNNSKISTLYYWTHTVPASGGVYPTNNFASYTLLGGTAAAAGGAIPNNKIQTGQGFYVKSSVAFDVKFENEQRLDAVSSTQFFRNIDNSTVNTESEKHRIWINLNNESIPVNQILIGYMESASNGFDEKIDGKTLDVTNSSLYNIINNEKYVIQGRSLPFSDEDIVPLGLKATVSGSYSISLETMDGLFLNQEVFLKDKYTNIIYNIKQSAYSFNSEIGTFDDRFEIIYKNQTLQNQDFISNDEIIVSSQNNSIVIKSSNEIINTIVVYDIQGKVILNNTNVNNKTYSIDSIQRNNQALFLKITLTTGQVLNKKIIF